MTLSVLGCTVAQVTVGTGSIVVAEMDVEMTVVVHMVVVDPVKMVVADEIAR